MNIKFRSVLKDWFAGILHSNRKVQQVGPPAPALFTMEKKACLAFI